MPHDCTEHDGQLADCKSAGRTWCHFEARWGCGRCCAGGHVHHQSSQSGKRAPPSFAQLHRIAVIASSCAQRRVTKCVQEAAARFLTLSPCAPPAAPLPRSKHVQVLQGEHATLELSAEPPDLCVSSAEATTCCVVLLHCHSGRRLFVAHLDSGTAEATHATVQAATDMHEVRYLFRAAPPAPMRLTNVHCHGWPMHLSKEHALQTSRCGHLTRSSQCLALIRAVTIPAAKSQSCMLVCGTRHFSRACQSNRHL